MDDRKRAMNEILHELSGAFLPAVRKSHAEITILLQRAYKLGYCVAVVVPIGFVAIPLDRLEPDNEKHDDTPPVFEYTKQDETFLKSLKIKVDGD